MRRARTTPTAKKNKYGKAGLNCLQKIRTGKQRWSFEKPIKTECVTRKLSPEELAALIAGDLVIEQIEPDEVEEIQVIPGAESFAPEEKTATVTCAADRNPFEVSFCKQLAKSINGLTEFPCPDGRIDILTEKYLIEVKVAQNWKHAIGQCLVYSHYFPSRQPVIFLIGDDAEYYAHTAKAHCNKYNIKICTSVKELIVIPTGRKVREN